MDTSRSPLARGSSVRQDWCAWLPEEKTVVFRKQAHRLESLYNMFSVSLNEALELRRAGNFAHSHKALRMAAELCRLLTCPLCGVLRALHEHSKHYGTTPATVPLDPTNYIGNRAQRSALLSGLLNRILLSRKGQFHHKVSTILEMVEDLDRDFRACEEDLTDAASMHPQQLWDEIAADHYDLNTCLREALVLLKSFLVALPASELAAFQDTIRDHCYPPKGGHLLQPAPINHRRMVAFAGK
ncbi:MAG TPA: hypothetical protein VE263_00675 [Candidatus Angelobacter sp.]|nr:hypothetical protein [Candidatus Angelobacter sp.]